MASHGAAKDFASVRPPAPRGESPRAFGKLPAKQLHHLEMRGGESGGVSVEHHFTNYEHKPEMHVFGDGDGHMLAAHIEKHLGIKMPGKSGADKNEPAEGDENEGKD